MKDKKTITFDLTTRDVLTINEWDEIYMRGYDLDNNDPCVLIITRKQWDELHEEFFRRKRDYNRSSGWAGVEFVSAEVKKERGKFTLLCPPDDGWDSNKDYMRQVKGYRATSVNLEMEHG